jgi:hypothetical protein
MGNPLRKEVSPMETPISHIIEHQRKALDFMLDALGLRQAYEEVSRLPETKEMERAVAALEVESDVLGAQIFEREPPAIPQAAQLGTGEREPRTEDI